MNLKKGEKYVGRIWKWLLVGELILSATFGSQQYVLDKLLQVFSSIMDPVSIILHLLSISRHLSGLQTHTHTHTDSYIIK